MSHVRRLGMVVAFALLTHMYAGAEEIKRFS
jgi:hypothetical protein